MNKDIRDIKTLIEYVKQLEQEAVAKTIELKALEERARYFREDIIPEFMFSLGLSEVKLDTGEPITIKTKYFGNISEDRSEVAHKWLKENGYASLIKSNIAMSFTDGLEDQVDLSVLTEFLTEKEINFNKKDAVHPQTLKAFIKQAMESGTNFPYHLFGVYVAKEVTMGEVKKP